MEKGYVSEFTVFMSRYLQEHPEVVEDQRTVRQRLEQTFARASGSGRRSTAWLEHLLEPRGQFRRTEAGQGRSGTGRQLWI